MWRILKAEFSYNKYWLVLSYTVFVLFYPLFFVSSVFENGTWNLKPFHIPMMMVLISIVSTMIMLKGKSAGKRDCFHMRLPASAQNIGISRVFFAVCVWISLLILFWIPLFMIKPGLLNRTAYLHLFYMNGVFLVFNAAWLIHIDSHQNIMRNRKIFGFYDKELLSGIVTTMIAIIWAFLFSMPYGYIFGIFEPQRRALSVLFFNLPAVIVLNIAGLALTYLSVEVFVRRKSFLE